MLLKISPSTGRRFPGHRVVAKAEQAAKQRTRWLVGHGLVRLAIARSERNGDVQGDLIMNSPGGHTVDLVPKFEEIRRQGPLLRGGFSYLAVDHAVIKETLTSPDMVTGFLSGGVGTGLLGRAGRWSAIDVFNPTQPPSLLSIEPPTHTQHRKLVTRVFTVRAVERLRARTQEVADELLDDLERTAAASPDGSVDVVQRYAGLLPITIISEILGVPVELRERMLALGNGAAMSLDLGLNWRDFRTMESCLVAFDTWLRGHLDELRANPGDNLLSKLVSASADEEKLDDQELRAIAGLVFAAGFETTVNLIGNGIALLVEHPDQLALLQDDPDLWPNAVDEILRIDPPVLLTGRYARQDTVIAGREIKHGEIISTVLAAANRDPKVFKDPEKFDVTRENAGEHLSFSSGRHYCLGAALARMEGQIALRSFFERYPDVTLLDGSTRRPTRILRGYEHLPARLS